MCCMVMYVFFLIHRIVTLDPEEDCVHLLIQGTITTKRKRQRKTKNVKH